MSKSSLPENHTGKPKKAIIFVKYALHTRWTKRPAAAAADDSESDNSHIKKRPAARKPAQHDGTAACSTDQDEVPTLREMAIAKMNADHIEQHDKLNKCLAVAS